MLSEFSAQDTVALLAMSCLVAAPTYIVIMGLIYLLQRWWAYATISEVGDSWIIKVLIKVSFHKRELFEFKNFWGDEISELRTISPFGNVYDDDETFVIKCGTVFALLPSIIFLTIYFWEAALILVVLALLTKLSRVVITVRRKLQD